MRQGIHILEMVTKEGKLINRPHVLLKNVWGCVVKKFQRNRRSLTTFGYGCPGRRVDNCIINSSWFCHSGFGHVELRHQLLTLPRATVKGFTETKGGLSMARIHDHRSILGVGRKTKDSVFGLIESFPLPRDVGEGVEEKLV